jgi:hypothetical protein
MGCPICRCPVVRNPRPFSSEGIAHQGCVDRQEAMRANEVRKRRAPPREPEAPTLEGAPGSSFAVCVREMQRTRTDAVATGRWPGVNCVSAAADRNDFARRDGLVLRRSSPSRNTTIGGTWS